MISDSSTSRLV